METTKRKKRTGRKRTQFKVPERMPLGVRELWQSATEEEQERAHRQATVVLQLWLGKTTKAEAAEALGVKPLRIWQLSQMAVSGMVAGLLKQPRKGRGRVATSRPEDDPVVLRKRVQELEAEVAGLERLVALVRDLPLAKKEESRGTKMERGGPKAGRKKARGGRTSSGRTGSDGGSAGRVGADAPQLDAGGAGGAAEGGQAGAS